MWSTTRCFLDIQETRLGARLGSTPFAVEPQGNRNRVIDVQCVFSDRRSRHDVVIVGAGPGGLAVARELGHQHQVSALVVDKASAPAMSWRNRYDNFRLNTNGYLSHLPGQRIPLSAGRWPSKEDMVGYFDSYVRQQNIRLALGSEVNRIERAAAGWRVDTSQGDIPTSAVVLATGRYCTPAMARAQPIHRRGSAFRRLPQRVAVPRSQHPGCRRGKFGRRHRRPAGRQRRGQGLVG